MKKDIILAGVGGQGILTIATIIGDAAAVAGLSLKQCRMGRGARCRRRFDGLALLMRDENDNH